MGVVQLIYRNYSLSIKIELDDNKVFSFLNDYNKVEIALTVLGLKPAFILEWWESIDKEELIKNESRELEGFLVSNSLVASSIFSLENDHVFCRIFCARDESQLSGLIDTEYDEGDSKIIIKKKDKKRGVLLGYPATAVDAYVEDSCIEDDELPDYIRNSAEFKFLQNRLSRGSWQVELEEHKRRIEVLKSNFPKLYSRIVNVG